MGILVTGGTGFIGAEVVRFLVERGEKDVFVFDINPSAKLLDDVKDRIELVRGDLGNFSHVLNIVKASKAHTVFHLGGMLSVPSDLDHAASFRANAMGTFHVLEAARLLEVPKVLFSSTIGTYGYDIPDEPIDDYTLQRPQLFYGATKVFGEHMGLFYKRKHGLDYRGIRYPSIVGPGVRTPGVAQYTSWVIEHCAQGKPFEMYVDPGFRCPVMYYKDAARAVVMLSDADAGKIQRVNYVVDGVKPTPSAGELADLVKAKIPAAQITFKTDPELKKILESLVKPIDDRFAKQEWGWEPKYDQARIIEDFLEELKVHPARYADG